MITSLWYSPFLRRVNCQEKVLWYIASTYIFYGSYPASWVSVFSYRFGMIYFNWTTKNLLIQKKIPQWNKSELYLASKETGDDAGCGGDQDVPSQLSFLI